MSYNNDEFLIPIDYNLSTLNHLISALYSENSNINKRFLYKIRELIELSDLSLYETDREMEVRFYLIKQILEAKLDKGLRDHELISEYALSEGQYTDEIYDIFDFISAVDETSDEEFIFLDEYITDRLRFSYIYGHEDKLEDLVHQLKSKNFDNLSVFHKKFEGVIENVYTDVKRIKSQSEQSHADFVSGDKRSHFNSLSETIDELNTPGNMIRTGIKMLNRMLGGGFQSSRVYTFLGVAKG